MEPLIIPVLFRQTAKRCAHRPALGQKPAPGQDYQYLSYAEVAERVDQLAAALLARGIAPDHKIALMSENTPAWPISDLGIMSTGALNVPIYPTLTHEQLAYILNDCAAKGIIVSNQTHYQKVVKIFKDVPSLEFVVYVDPISPDASCTLTTLSFAELLQEGAAALPAQRAELDKRLAALQPDQVCSIIYTSGTTGNPKGVMLSHANFMSNATVCAKLLVDDMPGDKLELSFLPLSHVLERVVNYVLIVVSGGTVAYAESIDTISQNMLEVRPTLLASVPRIYEKIYARVMDGVQQGSGLKRALFNWALEVGQAHFEVTQRGETPDAALKLKHRLADKLVFSKIKARTGGRLHTLVSGGAPLMKELAAFFAQIGLPILEGYGLTESSPVICLSRREGLTFGTVGPAIPGVEVKIGDQGEILARGPNIMKGYYNNATATSEVVDAEGWLHTGDVGELDAKGNLRITDRIKEILVMSNGKNVAPQPIENLLKTSRYIEQIALIGDNRKYISALIVPAFEAIEAKARELGVTASAREAILADSRVQGFMREEIDRISAGKVAQFEQIKQFRLLPAEWSIEKDEITPKLSLRRKIINQHCADLIEAMYSEAKAKA
ncbi:MAG: AMP-dependent synthetase/ligase [Candidatus Sericytochromatia bacterium]